MELMRRSFPFPSVASHGRGAFFLAALAISSIAAAQSQQSTLTTEQTPLPKGPPKTSLQGPIPLPVQPLPPAEHPLLDSPHLAALKQYAESNPLKLPDVIAIALYTSRDMANAIAALQRARAATGLAQAAMSPTIGISSQLTYFGQEVAFNTALLAPGTKGQLFVITPNFNPVTTAAFTVPLDLLGTLRSAVSQAQFNEVAARVDVNRVRNEVIASVKSAFYNVLRAQAQVAVATDNVNVSLTRLSDSNKNYAAGTAPYFDVLTARRDLADAQQALIAARGQVSTTLSTLKDTIGLDLSLNISISDQGSVEYPNGVTPGPKIGMDSVQASERPPGNGEEPQYAPNSNFTKLPIPDTHIVKDTFDYGPAYRAVLDEALKTRPEIFEAQARVTAANKGLTYAARSDMPSFNLSVEYVSTPNATGFSLPNQEVANLAINFPLWDGGIAAESVRDAKAVIAQAEVSRRQAQDQVQLDVQQAYIALVQARDRVAVTNAEVAQAQESYRLAHIRYNAGMTEQIAASPALELINAQTSLVQARTDQVNALYDYNSARAQLDRAIGRYSYMGVGPGYDTPPPADVVGTVK